MPKRPAMASMVISVRLRLGELQSLMEFAESEGIIEPGGSAATAIAAVLKRHLREKHSRKTLMSSDEAYKWLFSHFYFTGQNIQNMRAIMTQLRKEAIEELEGEDFTVMPNSGKTAQAETPAEMPEETPEELEREVQEVGEALREALMRLRKERGKK